MTDSYGYDLPLGMEIGRDFVLLTEDEQIKKNGILYKPYNAKSDVNRDVNYKMIKKIEVKKSPKDKANDKENH